MLVKEFNQLLIILHSSDTHFQKLTHQQPTYKQASAFYGAASGAFYDQGGDVEDHLGKCEFNDCHTASLVLSNHADDSKSRTERSIDSLNKYEQDLVNLITKLEKCAANVHHIHPI